MIPAQKAYRWLPLPEVPYSHQISEMMSISSQIQVLSCHFRGKTGVFRCVPLFGQIGYALQSHITPLAGAAPFDFQHSTAFFIFLYLDCIFLPPSCLWLRVHYCHSSWSSSSRPHCYCLENMWYFSFWLFLNGTGKDGKWKGMMSLRVAGSKTLVIAHVLFL